MNFFKKILLISILFANIAYGKVTPSDVFVEAKAIKIALASEVLKQKGVSLLPILDIDLKGATPLSVYSMGATLNNKLQVYAKIHNKPWKSTVYPNKKIVPADVKNLLLVVKENMKNIFDLDEFKADMVENKSPADVMVELVFANQWLDKIMPSVKPQYPYAVLKQLEKNIDKIYKKHNIKIYNTKAKKHKNITPNDVFVNVTATYNLLRNIMLTHTLQSSPTHPYNILSAIDKIKPLDIFTISTFNLYFFYTTALSLGVDDIDSTESLKIYPNIKPNDVFMQADIVNSKLANLIATGGSINVK